MFLKRFRIPNVGKLKKKRDYLRLIEALRHPFSLETRIAAVYALKKDERAIIFLSEAALEDQSSSVRLAALEVLRGLSWPLTCQLESGRDAQRVITLLRVVTRLKEGTAQRAVLTCLSRPEEGIRLAALEALAEIGDLETMPQLEKHYRETESPQEKERVEQTLTCIKKRFL